MVLASDSPLSDGDDMDTLSSNEISDTAEPTTRHGRGSSGANIPLSSQRRFRADDLIPQVDSERM
jgi:hypothetical protein